MKELRLFGLQRGILSVGKEIDSYPEISHETEISSKALTNKNKAQHNKSPA